MQLWFSRGSEVPIKDQLATQVILGILCGDLRPGERLPSTRDLARRFNIHPNTVSAGYRALERDRWVEARHGSGVYVRRKKLTSLSPTSNQDAAPALALDQLIADLFRAAAKAGIPLPTLRTRLRHWLAVQPPDHFLVIEPDEALREIVIFEMCHAVTLPIHGSSTEDCRLAAAGAIAVVLPSKAEAVRQLLSPETDLITLQLRSIRSSLANYLPAPADSLIGVASRWPAFLELAHTMLIAAGFHPDSLVLRNRGNPRWRQPLNTVSAIVCDSLTAAELPKKPPVIAFTLLSETSLAELKRCQNLLNQTS